MALYFADEAIVVTNPEVSSVRDSDRILGILSNPSRAAPSRTSRASASSCWSRATRPERVQRGEMLALDDVQEILAS
jgi:septum site-determining protein MinD